MKNVIKLLIFVLVVSMTTGAFAQNFGLKGGLNLSNILAKDDNTTYSDDFKMNPGFHIGATAEFPFSDMFSFETGLLLSTKGYKISEEETFMGKKIEMQVGSKKAIINGKAVELDTPPEITSGVTFVPIRFIADTLGAEVKWIAETREIIITILVY